MGSHLQSFSFTVVIRWSGFYKWFLYFQFQYDFSISLNKDCQYFSATERHTGKIWSAYKWCSLAGLCVVQFSFQTLCEVPHKTVLCMITSPEVWLVCKYVFCDIFDASAVRSNLTVSDFHALLLVEVCNVGIWLCLCKAHIWFLDLICVKQAFDCVCGRQAFDSVSAFRHLIVVVWGRCFFCVELAFGSDLVEEAFNVCGTGTWLRLSRSGIWLCLWKAGRLI